MISDWTEVAETFDSMGLHENLLRGIYAYGGRPASRTPAALSQLPLSAALAHAAPWWFPHTFASKTGCS